MILRCIVHGRQSPLWEQLPPSDDWSRHRAALTKNGLTFLEEGSPEAHGPRSEALLSSMVDRGVIETHERRWLFLPDLTGRYPLFYLEIGHQLLLSDSPHALLEFLPEVAVEPMAVSEYLLTGSVFPSLTPGCLLQGLGYLESQQSLLVTESGFSFSSNATTSKIEQCDNMVGLLRAEIDQSTAAAIRGHRRVACLVSGGLDSCGLAATSIRLEQELGHQTILLNVGGGLGSTEEQVLRERFSTATGRPIVPVTPDESRGMVEALVEANREAPYPMGCSFAAIFESIGRVAVDLGCTQLLSGDGGDELFSTPPYFTSELPLAAGCLPMTAFAAKGSQTQRFGLREAAHQCRDRLQMSTDEAPHNAVPATSEYAAEVEIGGKLVENGGFVPRFDEFLELWWRSRMAIKEAGGLVGDEWRWRQWRLVPTYEPSFSYIPAGDPLRGLSVACPLASEGLFRLVSAQRLEDQCEYLSRGVGKDLLREVFADRLPREISHHPKVGTIDDSNLDSALLSESSELSRLISGVGLVKAGVKVPRHGNFALWRRQIGSAAFYRVIILAAWLEGLHAYGEENRRQAGNRSVGGGSPKELSP